MIAPFPWEGEQNPAYALLSHFWKHNDAVKQIKTIHYSQLSKLQKPDSLTRTRASSELKLNLHQMTAS